MASKDVIELSLLVVVSFDRVSRWIYRRETTDQTLVKRLAEMDAGWDDKADSACVQELEDEVDKVRQELGAQLRDVGDKYHRKFNELNVSIGQLATAKDVDLVRGELRDLRLRVDNHFDKGE